MNSLSRYLLGLKTTGGTPVVIPLGNIISEYKMDGNANDTVGSNNGAETSVNYVSGLVGQAGDFNGSTSNILVPDNINLSFTDGVNDLLFSISLLMKLDNPTGNNGFLLCKMAGNGTAREYDMRYYGTTQNIMFNKYSNATNVYIRSQYDIPTPFTNSEYVHVVVTNLDNGYPKIYVNGVRKDNVYTDLGYVKMAKNIGGLYLGKYPAATSLTHDGLLDCVRLWDVELTPAQILELATRELAGEDINP